MQNQSLYEFLMPSTVKPWNALPNEMKQNLSISDALRLSSTYFKIYVCPSILITWVQPQKFFNVIIENSFITQ